MNEKYTGESASRIGYQGQQLTPSYGSTALTPAAMPVHSALQHLSAANAALHDRVSCLVDRLQRVLAPSPPTSVSEQAQKGRGTLAHDIDDGAVTVEFAAQRLDDIINRLEL